MRRTSLGVDSNSVRHWNEVIVIEALRRHGELRIAQLCQHTGLTPSTMGQVLRGLETKGWVTARLPEIVGRGRPAHLYALTKPTGSVVGLDIGAHAARVVRMDLHGGHVAQSELRLPRHAGNQERRTAVTLLLAEVHDEAHPVWATTLAVGGHMSPDGLIKRSVAIPEWDGQRPSQVFADLIPGPIFVINDVRAATLAEHRIGAGQGFEDILIAQLGRRPTLGHLIHGSPRAGAHGTAGDLSNSTLVPAEADMTWLAPYTQSLDPLGDAVRDALDGDEAALKGALSYVQSISPALSFAAAITDPEVFVIAGALSPLAEHFIEPLRATLDATSPQPPVTVVSTLDQFSPAHGAALDAQERIYATLLTPATGAAPLTRDELLTRLSHDLQEGWQLHN